MGAALAVGLLIRNCGCRSARRMGFERLPDGYYWARDDAAREGFPYVTLLDGGLWYVCGVSEPIREFDERLVICPIKRPVH